MGHQCVTFQEEADHSGTQRGAEPGRNNRTSAFCTEPVDGMWRQEGEGASGDRGTAVWIWEGEAWGERGSGQGAQLMTEACVLPQTRVPGWISQVSGGHDRGV